MLDYVVYGYKAVRFNVFHLLLSVASLVAVPALALLIMVLTVLAPVLLVDAKRVLEGILAWSERDLDAYKREMSNAPWNRK